MNRWILGSIISFGCALFELSLPIFISECHNFLWINFTIGVCFIFLSFICYLFGRIEDSDDIFNNSIDERWKFLEHTKYGALYVCLNHENHYRINPKVVNTK